MKYEDYALEDFLLDDDFIRWVKNADGHGSSRSGDSRSGDSRSGTGNLFWESWIAQHPEKKPLIEEARLIISSLQFEDDGLSAQEVTEIWQNLDPESHIPHKANHQQPGRPKVAAWQKIAAVLGGLVFLAAFYYLWSVTGINSMQQYSTAYGQTKTIMLPDGSEVTLNANSQLKYTGSRPSDSIRQVWLEGEAFFSVTHQENDQKFIVHSGDVTIEVLGTEFNVHHRREKTQVVLNTGKIKLQNHRQHAPEEVMMNPGELVEIGKNHSGYIKKVVNTELYTSWKKNKLIFDGTSVAEIAQLLEDNYGYTVTIQDSLLAAKQFKGAVPADEIDNLLVQMAKVFNADIESSPGDDKQIIMKLKAK